MILQIAGESAQRGWGRLGRFRGGGGGLLKSLTCLYLWISEDSRGEAVLHCLRALCQWAQRGESNPNIGWGGTGEKSWAEIGNKLAGHS
jgi:hypothetical protein